MKILSIERKVKSLSTLTLSIRKFSKQIIDTDVLIIGGGVIGLSLANALKVSNTADKISILDQSEMKFPADQFKYHENRIPDMRAISLTPGSMNFIRAIGVEGFLNPKLLTYVKEMQVWEKNGSNFVNFKSDYLISIVDSIKQKLSAEEAKTFKENYISTMIEMNHLQMALSQNLNSSISRINYKMSHDNFHLDNTNDNYCLLTLNDNNTTYRTKLLIISDGPKSFIRSKLNLNITGYDYHESGIVCTLKGNKNTQTSFQRFLHDGIFALLPMYDSFYSIVCSMPKEINEKLKEMSEKDFISFVNNVLHSPSLTDYSHIGRLIQDNSNNFHRPPIIESIHSDRVSFPFQLQYVDDPVCNNCIIIGDSAHTVHPLAGQGMNLGLADAAILSNLLSKGKEQGKRLNDKSVLSDFSLNAQINTKSMIAGMELFKFIYQRENILFTSIRNLGMELLNSSNILKGLMTDFASGKILLPNKYNWENI